MQSEALHGEVENAPTQGQMQASAPSASRQTPGVPEAAEAETQPLHAQVSQTIEPRVLVQAPRKSRPWIWIATQWILVLILAGAAGGLGYRAQGLNRNLNATQQKLAALQMQYDQLKSEKEGLSAELEQTKSEFQSTQSEVVERSLTDGCPVSLVGREHPSHPWSRA